jgi:hypothetical protein
MDDRDREESRPEEHPEHDSDGSHQQGGTGLREDNRPAPPGHEIPATNETEDEE